MTTRQAYRRASRAWPHRALTVLLLSAVALAGCDSLLSTDARIARAQTEFDTGKYAAAMADVKTALEGEPENAAGRVLLARIAVRLGDAEGARKELERALAAGADPVAVADLNYDILLGQGRYEDVVLTAAADDGPGKLHRLLSVATAQLALGRHDEAETAITEALAIDANSREAQLARARLLWATGKLQEAGDALGALLERHPDFARGWLYLARIRFGVGDADRARQAYEKARPLAEAQLDIPEQLTLLAGLVESRLALGDIAGAGTDLGILQRSAPQSFLTQFLNARVAYAKGDHRVAAEELQRAIKQQPGNVPARLLLGASLFALGSLEQADSTLSALVTEHPENIEARKLLARVYLSRNDREGARRVLAEAPAGDEHDPGADWLSGSILMMSGQSTEAIALLERSAAEDPTNVQVKLDLAQAQLSLGQRERAIEVLRSVPRGEGGLRRHQLAVLAETAGRGPAEARRAIDALVKESPKDAALLTVAGFYLFASGDGEAARGLFDKALAVAPTQTEARLGLAAVAMRGNDLAAAEQQLNGVLKVNAATEAAYLGLANVAVARGDRAAARQALERAVSAVPAAVESRLRLAELSLADNDPVRAKAIVEQTLAVTRERPATLDRIGQIYLRASLYDEALARFNDAAGLGHPQAGVRAAVALGALGRRDEARARLEEVVRQRPGEAAPVAMLVALDIDQRRYDPALTRIQAFQKAGGTAFAADEMRGDVQLAAGRQAEAVATYERAFRARPSAPVAIKLYRARRAAGQATPESSLVSWLEGRPRDPVVRLLLAEHYQLQGDRKAAIGQYETAVRDMPSPAAINNLAWLYHEVRDPRALATAKRAYDALPENASIADTYGWILVESGRAAEGLPLLEKIGKDAAAQPDIRYHYAAALAQAGQQEAALAVLRELLDKHAKFATRGEAEALLKSLSAG